MTRMYITAPDGRVISMAKWAEMNGVSKDAMRKKYAKGERDPYKLLIDTRNGKPLVSHGDEIKPPVLSEAKKGELRMLAKFSDGQSDQMKMLCDFVPCSHRWAGWLKKELAI